jgi:hypothetical protein
VTEMKEPPPATTPATALTTDPVQAWSYQDSAAGPSRIEATGLRGIAGHSYRAPLVVLVNDPLHVEVLVALVTIWTSLPVSCARLMASLSPVAVAIKTAVIAAAETLNRYIRFRCLSVIWIDPLKVTANKYLRESVPIGARQVASVLRCEERGYRFSM